MHESCDMQVLASSHKLIVSCVLDRSKSPIEQCISTNRLASVPPSPARIFKTLDLADTVPQRASRQMGKALASRLHDL